MEKKNKKDNRKMVTIIVILLILCLSIGFSLFSSQLRINGHASINASEWKIEIDDVSKKTEGKAKFTSDVVVSNNKLEITYTSDLYAGGDSSSVIFTVYNRGTIDAELASLPNLNVLDNAQKNYLTYTLKYDDGSNLNEGDVILAGKSRTMVAKMTFKRGVDSSLLPTTKQTINNSFKLDYRQIEK